MGKIRIFLESIFNSNRFNLYAFGLIAVLIIIAYSNTFTASFHFDDNPAIIENPNIRHITTDNLIKILAVNRPVVNLSIMLNYLLGGLNVVGWHIFNVGVHITNSCFVYLLMLWTINLAASEKDYSNQAKRMALFGALLFAVHPVQTESVTYIISRSELLATFFYLAAFLFFIKGSLTKNKGYYVATIFSSALSMGSKEWAVTLPALLMLYDYMFIAEGKTRVVLERWWMYVGVALTWWIVLSKLNLFAPAAASTGGVGFNITSTTGITSTTYLLTSFNVIWTYVRLLFLPINQNLDYDYPIAKTLLEFPTIISFMGHFIMVLASFWLYRKKGWLLIPFGVAWFYIGLSPVQSFVPVIDVIFEHRLYMPSIGFIIVFITTYEWLFDRLSSKHVEKKATQLGNV